MQGTTDHGVFSPNDYIYKNITPAPKAEGISQWGWKD